MKTLEQAIAEKIARDNSGPWQPACGGAETPFTVGTYRYTYMYQPSSGKHAYYCHDTDLFVDDIPRG